MKTLAMLTALALTGCSYFDPQPIGDYAQSQMSARERYNAERLAAAIRQAETPVIEFELSQAAIQALAKIDPGVGPDGHPLPTIRLTYTPRTDLPGYIEAPYWRLLPSGGELISGVLGGYALWSSHEVHTRSLDNARAVSLREIDSRDALLGTILAAPEQAAEPVLPE